MIDEAAISCLALAELSRQAIFSFDINSKKFIYVNQAFREHVQLEDRSISDSAIRLLFHPEDAAFVMQSYRDLIEKESTTRIEFRLILPDKTIKSVRVEAFNTLIGDSRQVITGIMEDITAFKDHNDTLNKFSNKKNSILTILSHDLLGPLGTIQNLTAILSKKITNADHRELYRFVNSIDKISRNTIALIRSLLTQEFLESADAELVLRRTNLVEALGQMFQEYKTSEETVKRTFNFSASKQAILVDIDETKLMQAVNNLVSNALKFTHENGIISLSIAEEDAGILLKVADNGIGIPKKHQASLFEKFTAARRPGLQGESSHGLGMSIVKTIIDWHHGEIWFETEENVGTTFYIRLPTSKQNIATEPN
jgi:two-component system sensor histidine kinase VicK